MIQEVKQGKAVAAAAQGLSLISMEVRKLPRGLGHLEAELNPGATVIQAEPEAIYWRPSIKFQDQSAH